MAKYFILILMLALTISSCAYKKQPSFTYKNKKYYVTKSKVNSTKNSERLKQDLKEIFPEAGTCPIDSNKVDPESDQGKLDMALELCRLSQDLWMEGDKEGAIKVLDDAYELMLSVENEDNDPSIEQQKDDLRFLISKRLLEIHASRFRTTKGFNTSIPLTINKYVKRELDLFTGKEKDFFISAYKRSGKYRPMIIKELKKAGLPVELSWLPLIESGFKVNALSPARALGLWQFIPSTGYKFGLKRNVWVDERLDPEKSTKAAILYLTELHEIFGDWSTVLAAYNCGERTVLKAIDKQKINYLDNFWDLYERLPRETARYVPRFIATLLIIKNPEKYGMKLGEPDRPIPYEQVIVKKQMALKDIAKAIGVDLALLKELNPSLRHGVTPKSSFELKVPKGFSEVLIAKLDTIKEWQMPKRYVSRSKRSKIKKIVKRKKRRPRIIKHRVRRGETLAILAKRYHSTIRAIKRANRLRSSRIRVGQVLKIPTGKYVRKIRKARKKKKRKIRVYIVKRGDTLWEIAKRFKVSVTTLRRVNRLSSNCLAIGQVLTIPSS